MWKSGGAAPFMYKLDIKDGGEWSVRFVRSYSLQHERSTGEGWFAAGVLNGSAVPGFGAPGGGELMTIS
jgi:hypothetical protein